MAVRRGRSGEAVRGGEREGQGKGGGEEGGGGEGKGRKRGPSRAGEAKRWDASDAHQSIWKGPTLLEIDEIKGVVIAGGVVTKTPEQ